MATCCIPGCDNELTGNARLRTCATCRQSLHNWERRRPAEILIRSQTLSKWRARMNTFSSVKDDEIELVSHEQLEQKKLMSFPVRKAKKQAKANIVEFKLRAKRRKTA